MTKPTALPETGFIRLPQVLAVIPISRSQWLKGVKEGKYPKPVKLGARITAWRVGDIKQLIEELQRPSEPLPKPLVTIDVNPKRSSRFAEIAKFVEEQKKELRRDLEHKYRSNE